MASMKMGLGRLWLDKGEASIITFEQLDDIAHAISDNEAAIRMNEAKHQLFKSIIEQEQQAA